MSDVPNSATSIQVLSRMFALLDTLAREGNAVSLKSISEQTGLHPSTAHRILNDLVAGRYVDRSGPGSYRLGLRLLELGNQVKARLDVRELASRPMQDLHRLTGHPVSLFVRQENEALCVARTVVERNGVQVTRVTGQRLPLTAHVLGKVLLVNDSSPTLQAITGIQGQGLELLQTELHAIRHNGIALEDDEQDSTRQLVVAPVLDDQGAVAASLSLNIPATHLLPEWQDALRNTAQRVSASMGWQKR